MPSVVRPGRATFESVLLGVLSTLHIKATSRTIVRTAYPCRATVWRFHFWGVFNRPSWRHLNYGVAERHIPPERDHGRAYALRRRVLCLLCSGTE